MANNITNTFSSELIIPAGVLSVADWDSDNSPQGFLDLGEMESFTINVTGERTQVESRRTQAREQILDVSRSIARTGSFTLFSFNVENLKLWLAGTDSTVTQTASAVTDEEIKHLKNGREHYLGTSTSNPVGILGATSITINNLPSAAAAHATSTAYSIGDVATSGGASYRCKVAGTSAGSAPTFVTTTLADHDTEGSLTTDGTVTWEYIAATATQSAFTANTDYQLDDTEASGARFKWINSSSQPRYVFVDYTPTASTRTRIVTGEAITKTVSARFKADNSTGSNDIWYMHKCTIAPEGDLGFLNDGSAPNSMTFNITVLKDDNYEAIVRDTATA